MRYLSRTARSCGKLHHMATEDQFTLKDAHYVRTGDTVLTCKAGRRVIYSTNLLNIFHYTLYDAHGKLSH
jgi:hypothetical protein